MTPSSPHAHAHAQSPNPDFIPPCPSNSAADVRARRSFALVPPTLVLVLSIATYGLRLVARARKRRRRRLVGWDDYLMGAGILFSFEPAICEYLLVANGLGHHFCSLSPKQAAAFWRISWALERANQPALACVKISIVLFYTRVFRHGPFLATTTRRKFHVAAHAVVGYTVAWALATWFANLVATSTTPLTYVATACTSLLGDALVLLLPLPMVFHNLRADGGGGGGGKRLGLAAVFLLGCFGCFAAAARILELSARVADVAIDASYTQPYAAAWTTAELGAAILCGNLLALGPLLPGRGHSSRRGNKYNKHAKAHWPGVLQHYVCLTHFDATTAHRNCPRVVQHYPPRALSHHPKSAAAAAAAARCPRGVVRATARSDRRECDGLAFFLCDAVEAGQQGLVRAPTRAASARHVERVDKGAILVKTEVQVSVEGGGPREEDRSVVEVDADAHVEDGAGSSLDAIRGG